MADGVARSDHDEDDDDFLGPPLGQWVTRLRCRHCGFEIGSVPGRPTITYLVTDNIPPPGRCQLSVDGRVVHSCSNGKPSPSAVG